MTSIRQIISDNNNTFYDYRSGKRKTQYGRLLLTAITSFIAAILLDKPNDELISAIITVQAILVGFGFSVLFFLVSADHKSIDDNATIEVKERHKRLNKLSDELFYNVSYYNLITVCSVVFSLIFLLSGAAIASNHYISMGVSYVGEDYQNYMKSGWFWIGIISKFVFYMLFIESMYTFYRIVVRVNFFFSQKRKI